jgi:hypothetical protein
MFKLYLGEFPEKSRVQDLAVFADYFPEDFAGRSATELTTYLHFRQVIPRSVEFT